MAIGRRRSGTDTAGNRNFELLAQSKFQFIAHIFIFLEEDASVFTALAHAVAAKADPRAALFQDATIHAQIDEVAFAGNSFALDNVEFGFAEWRSHFVLYDFGPRA